MITASVLARAAACPTSFWMPPDEIPHEDVDDATARGTAIHAFLCDALTLGREEALAAVEEKWRRACAAIDLGRLPVNDPSAYSPEVAVAYQPTTDIARLLGSNIDRKYGEWARRDERGRWLPINTLLESMNPSEEVTFGTADVVGVTADRETAFILDYKTGRRVTPARRNWQLKLLAVGIARALGCSSVVVGIVYVWEDREPFYDLAEWSAFELAGIAMEIEEVVARVAFAGQLSRENPNMMPIPIGGSHCTYCPSYTSCPRKLGLVRALGTDPEGALSINGPLDASTAESLLVLLDEAEEALDRVRGQFHNFAKSHPITLKNGLVYGPVESKREAWNARAVHKLVEQAYGREIADACVEWKAPKAQVRRALRPTLKPGEKLVTHERWLVSELRKVKGGVRVTINYPIKAHRADALPETTEEQPSADDDAFGVAPSPSDAPIADTPKP